MSSKNILSLTMLMLTAIIWGSAFVAQSIGLDSLGPYTFNGLRSFIGGIVLLLFIKIKDKNTSLKDNKKPLFYGGFFCGLVLFFGSSLQQHGLIYTSVGKAGFITTLYVVIVPILGLFLKKKVEPKVWLALMIAVIGMYFLCINESFSINRGDILLLIGALFFSIHILLIDHYIQFLDGIKLACIQLFVCGTISLFPMALLETVTLEKLQLSLAPLLYTGLLSSGIGYTMQIIAQKNVNPVIASLILSLESVFSAIAGWLILKQILSSKEILGCGLVFFAVILTQLPILNSRKNSIY